MGSHFRRIFVTHADVLPPYAGSRRRCRQRRQHGRCTGPHAGVCGSLARLRGRAGADRRRHLVGRRRRASPTRSRSPGRRGVGIRAAARRSRSVGRGSRLPARADANGGRAARIALPPATPAVPLVASASASATATPSLWRASISMCRAGTIVGIVGPNGSGKTTLLHAVAGLVALDAGTIEVAGSPAGSRLARAAAALVPDDPAGLDELTVEEHIALVHALWRPGVAAATRAEALLSAFGLGPRRAATARDALSRPAQASECRRRLLARAAAPPRRRGDCDARSRGRRRPRRGAGDARGGRLRGAARHPGSPLRRSRL